MPMPSGAQRSFFDPEAVCPDCVELGTLPWLLARHAGLFCPLWLVRAWEGCGDPGRDPWPVRVLLPVLLLQFGEGGVSRRAAIRRARTDAGWRAAMGLSFRERTPSRRVVGRFEGFLLQRDLETGVPRYLRLFFDIGRVCIDAGVLGPRPVWANDSTPMICYGAVLDTVRQLGEGAVSLAREWAKVNGTTLETLATEWRCPLLLAKSIKGHFRHDWSDLAARSDMVDEVATTAVAIASRIRSEIETVRANKRKGLLRRCRNLARVVAQDLERDEDGRLVIARRVMADRLVSYTDPEARHGRKSQSVTFDGFKVHVLGDVVSGLIAALCVTAGNVHDGTPACRLVLRAKQLAGDIERVLGDTAYGGARLRHMVRGVASVEIVAPPPADRPHPDGLGKQDFTVDFERNTMTCPQGNTVEQASWSWSGDDHVHVPMFKWEAAICRACPVRDRCLPPSRPARGDEPARPPGPNARKRVLLHAYEADLRAARAAWEDAEVRQDYRVRSQCERIVNQMTRHGARQARRWGLAGAQLQAHTIAIGCNLALLARALAQLSAAT